MTDPVSAAKQMQAVAKALSALTTLLETGDTLGTMGLKETLLQTSNLRDSDEVFFPSLVEPKSSGNYTAQEQLLSIDKCMTSMLAHSKGVGAAMIRHREVLEFAAGEMA